MVTEKGKIINVDEAIRIILCFIHSFVYQGCATTIAYYKTYSIDYFRMVYARGQDNDEVILEIKNKITELKEENELYEELGSKFLKEIDDITQEVTEEEKYDIVGDIIKEFIKKFNTIIDKMAEQRGFFYLDYNDSIAKDYASLCNINISSELYGIILDVPNN